MKFSNLYKTYCVLGLSLAAAAFSSCKKDGNPNNLPDVDAAKYEGTIDGFKSTDDIYPQNLVAYFSFDENNNDKVSGNTPTAANATLVDGFKGKALNLNQGYLYYTTAFNAFKTANLKSFTISQWIQISNNGATKTQLFQLARPGMLNGNIDLILETNSRQASDVNNLTIHPYFITVGGGRQDNLNANSAVKIGPSNWVHMVLAYNGATGRFNIVVNGVNIGSYSDRGVGTSLFNSYEPNELIIGGNYNTIPGKSVSADASFGAMTGKIDELRIYNIFMSDAIVKSLYKLGLAKK